jgi:putative transposase
MGRKRPKGTVVRSAVRYSARGVTARKLGLVEEIGRRYLMTRRMYVRELYPTDRVVAVISPINSLTTRRWREGFVDVELLSHHHKMAFEEAVGLVKGGWEQTFARVKTLVCANPRWSEPERKELCYLLASPPLIARVVAGEIVEQPNSNWAGNDQRELCVYMRRLVLAHRTPAPRRERQKRAFVADNTAYRVFSRLEDKHLKGVWISISTLPGQKPMAIPLAGKTTKYLDGPGQKNLRVTLEGDRIRFTIARDVPVPTRSVENDSLDRTSSPEVVVGIDKGMSRFIAANSAEDPAKAVFYGDGEVAKMISETSDRPNRDRLCSYVRELEKTAVDQTMSADARVRATIKAGHIHSANLGSVKLRLRNDRDHRTIVGLTNRASNELFVANPDMTVLVEEDLSRMRGDTGKGRDFNRRVSRWMCGALSDSLSAKCTTNGVRREVVNAAYTSQACPICSWTESKNRKGTVFHCRKCGYEAHSDAVAATNVRARFTDSEISRYMARSKVLEILLERWHRRSELPPGAQTAVAQAA